MTTQLASTLILAAMVLSLGCGGGFDRSEGAYDPTVKVIDPPPGADPGVPPELGGAGFGEIAEELGWQTYIPEGEDLRYFGDSRAQKGGMLVSYTSRFPATLRVIGQHSNYAENSLFGGMIYEGLLSTHPKTLEYTPSLASHWKVSPDRMTYWFRINPDARWSDGHRVTADDVITTYRLRMDPGILSPSDQMTFGKFEPPVAESPYIIRVRAKEFNWRNLLYFGLMRIMPAHKLSELAEEHSVSPDSVGKAFLEEYQFKMLPGSGPYYMRPRDIRNQQSYTLTRRDDYWAADRRTNRYLYNLDRIQFVVIKDSERLPFEKFKKHELDIYVVSRAQWWAEETEFESVQKGHVLKRRVFTESPAGTNGFAFNMREEPFDDIRVRKAFRHLFNRESMISELFYDQYLPTNSLYAGSVYEHPDNETFPYDPERAIQLLAEAGYAERNERGQLLTPQGRPFQLEMGIPKVMERIITPFQQELSNVGIELQLKFQDGNALWKMLMERNFKLYWVNWGGLVFPNPETSLHSRLAPLNDTNNISGIMDKKIDLLCAEYDTTFSQAARIRIVQEIDSLAMAHVPTALGWYAPYTRILFWNKYGYPEHYLGRYGDATSIYSYWWYDPDKSAALAEARRTGATLDRGETDVPYWPDLLGQERD